MKEIVLNNTNIVSVKRDVEYYNWTCPYCGNDNRTIEFNVCDNELFCTKCGNQTRYSFTYDK